MRTGGVDQPLLGLDIMYETTLLFATMHILYLPHWDDPVPCRVMWLYIGLNDIGDDESLVTLHRA